MPAGGGVAGGGGGGGGGGFSSVGSSIGGGGTNAVLSLLSCICVIVIMVVIAVPVGITQNRPPDVPTFYSPGDSRILSYGSTFFCAGITLTDRSARVDSTLYLISDAPPLTDQNNFTFTSSLTLADNIYQYWNYYLYPNSNFTTELCTRPNSTGGVFYLIKGRSTFQSWISGPTTDLALGFFSIANFPCSGPKHQFWFPVETEDEYYFVYYNHARGDSRLPFLRLNLTISIDRFQYSTSTLNSVANCSTSTTGKCSLTVPYGSNYRALIVTDIPDSPDWEENVKINLHCIARGWAYAVVVLVPIVSVVGCIAALVVCCYCWLKSILKEDPSEHEAPSNHSNTGTSSLESGLPAAEPQDESGLPAAEPQDESGLPAAEPQDDTTLDPLNGEQGLTAIPPPTYGASLAYHSPTANSPQINDNLPPPPPYPNYKSTSV